ncbi:MAG: hypothetical protein COX65_02365 [Elusimicrobia bacterium CG_4_10_14_0_2_um_filter_56_8]|nr:MAG: hypothetical protein COX65_02365 [Elusimicrobia bacterium CG_4_10_14_0_2_um_filter_56_8]
MESRNITIMLTDIKGFTSKTAGFSREQTQEMLSKHRELVLPVIEKFGGRLVKTIGDAFLVAFNSPTDAVICGVEVQSVLRAHNGDKAPGEKIEIRIAINSGEVAIHDDGDIYGDAVNITSRLESIAEAGEVFFTESVYLSMNKKEVPSSEIGYRQFKGIPEKIKVFRVLRETPVGAQQLGVAADIVTGTTPAAAAGADPETALPAAGQHAPAGFWRRLGSLLTDVVILLIVLNTFGLHSCGPKAKWSTKDKFGSKEMTIQDVNINAKGITLKGNNGGIITLTKEEMAKEKAGESNQRYTRTKTSTAGFDAGSANNNTKNAPLKILLWALYCGVALWRFAASPGMKIFKLKAVDFTTGGPLAADKAFLRAFFSLVSLFLLLGYAWAIWEKDKRTWHDIIAGTRVVKA